MERSMFNKLVDIIKNNISRIKKYLYGIAITVSLVLIGSLSYQFISDFSDRRSIPVFGDTIVVDGKKVHYIEKGTEFKGSKPTIILISGIGTSCLDWWLVQEELAKSSHAISYDRFGIGGSDSYDSARTPENIAKELNKFLKAKKLNSSLLLVGQSLGALHAKAYAALYPKKVAGLVFVDGVHESIFKASNGIWSNNMVKLAKYLWWKAIFGIRRYDYPYDRLPAPIKTHYSEDMQKAYRLYFVSTRGQNTTYHECKDSIKESVYQFFDENRDYSNIDTMVLAASRPETLLTRKVDLNNPKAIDLFRKDWNNAQKNLARECRSNKLVYQVIPNSPHNMAIYSSSEIIKAIKVFEKTLEKEIVTYPSPILDSE